jgi:hypothetical protein
MTWDEFKSAVDKSLAEQGADGSIEIWYIDASYPGNNMSIMVNRHATISEPDEPWFDLSISD